MEEGGGIVKLAINGLGRIGRLVLRQLARRDDLEIVAVNDLADPRTLAHLVKYDSMHGKADFPVSHRDDAILLGDRSIRVHREREPGAAPFGASGAELVLECSGAFSTREDFERFLGGSVRHVLVSAPVAEADATLLMGVNEASFDPEAHRVVSGGGATSNCLAPLVKVLDEAFGVEYGMVTAVRAYGNDQRILDLPHRDLRKARAAALSMIPTPTESTDTLGRVMPHLAGRLDGLTVRVPTPDVSLVDFSAMVRRPATREAILEAFRAAAERGPLKGFLDIAEDELVSMDLRGNPASCVFDPYLTRVMSPRYVKVFGWYDNEFGYASRMKDLVLHMLGSRKEAVR